MPRIPTVSHLILASCFYWFRCFTSPLRGQTNSRFLLTLSSKMSLLFRRQEFSPSCPSGGDWYACETGSKFVGCCNSSPCVNGCPDGNLAPASFDPAFYGKFNDQECPKGSRWYSCAYTNPPFLGCCKSVACGAETGCPVGDLTAGFLSSNPYIAEGYLSSANSSATSSASSTPAETSAAARPVVTSSSTKAPIGAIVGGVVGGLAVIAILVILLLWYRKRKASKPHQHISELDAPPEKPTPMYKDGVLSEPGTQDGKHGVSPILFPPHNLIFQSPRHRIFLACANIFTLVSRPGLPFRNGRAIRPQTAPITIRKLVKSTRYQHWKLQRIQFQKSTL